MWEETSQRLEQWWSNNEDISSQDYSNIAPIVVVTGFVAKSETGVPTTLKRSGSDYSATIFAKLTDAARVTMWKNTNGVYTADPRRVPEAFPIASLKYDEAMELAYFGAQVLHPSAMEPCIDKGIPVYVRNIFNPAFEGTVISGRCKTLKESQGEKNVKNWRAKRGEIPIKGITSVDNVALVTLEGASLSGADVATRFMGAMSRSGITVLIITQASSESSITVAVPENQGIAALADLEDAFELEDYSVVIVFLGANDPWDMTIQGRYIRFGSEPWATVYRERVARIINTAAQHRARLVWLGVPPLGREDLVGKAPKLNAIYAEEADKMPLFARFVATDPTLTADGSSFTKFLELPDRGSVMVRTDDGVHFTTQGHRLLANLTLTQFGAASTNEAPADSTNATNTATDNKITQR